jgi:hypothetical protein
MPTSKEFLDYMMQGLREETEENLWLAAYLTGAYVDFLKIKYGEEEPDKKTG